MCVCVFVQLGQQTGRGDCGKASVAVISQFSGLRERRTEKGLTEITAVTSHHTHTQYTSHTHTHINTLTLHITDSHTGYRRPSGKSAG